MFKDEWTERFYFAFNLRDVSKARGQKHYG